MTMLRPLLVTAAAFAASSAGAASLEGTWLRGDGSARVRIAPCGDKICATNLWVKDASSGEAVGDRLVMTLTRRADGTYSGTAYDSKRSLSYSMTIRASAGALDSQGCVLGGIVCRRVTWRSAK